MSFGLGSAGGGAAPSSSSMPQHEQEIDDGTPWMAASDGNLGLMQTALGRLELPIHAADENGYTLLQAAASYSQIHVMEWLLQQQQQQQQVMYFVNAVDHDGDTALHYASTEAAARLLCEKANIDRTICNKEGKTALQAKQEELQEMMEDEDYEDDDEDAVKLRAVVQYLSTLDTMQQ